MRKLDGTDLQSISKSGSILEKIPQSALPTTRKSISPATTEAAFPPQLQLAFNCLLASFVSSEARYMSIEFGNKSFQNSHKS